MNFDNFEIMKHIGNSDKLTLDLQKKKKIFLRLTSFEYSHVFFKLCIDNHNQVVWIVVTEGGEEKIQDCIAKCECE
jgi:hypothetical protein